MNMISNILKHVILLLIIVMLSACAGRHQNSQPVSGGDTWEKKQQPLVNREEIAALQNDLAALNGRTNPVEARQVAETAIRYSAFLADEYDLIRPAVFHNVLVRIGLKDRGLCHHWTADLMKQLELLELQSYHLYWGVAHRGSELREHNSVVVAARGHNIEKGIVLDPWRNSGDLYWVPVKDDRYPWQERPRIEW
jgi:hypothetical protein